MLFIIAAIFIICSIPRAILNLVELEHMTEWYYERYVDPEFKARDPHCFDPPVWAIVLNHFSKFMMTFNSCCPFFTYCVSCKVFRKELKKQFSRCLVI